MQSREIRLGEHTASFPQCILYSHFGKQAETLKFGLFLSHFCWECVAGAQESYLLHLAVPSLLKVSLVVFLAYTRPLL